MKHLFIVGMEKELQNYVISQSSVPRDEMIVLTCFGPFISESYDSLLRSVILAVYQNNVKEITIVGTAGGNQSALTGGEVMELMKRAEVEVKTLQTVDYLFNYCKPGFMANNLKEWLQGGESVAEGIQKTVELIRNHPLMPQGIKVSGILMNTEDEERFES